MTTPPPTPLWRQMLEARERAGPLPALQIAAELEVVIDYLNPGIGLIPPTVLPLVEQATLAREHAAQHPAP